MSYYTHDESNLYDGNEGGERCHRHPEVEVTSPCGRFDSPCNNCENDEPASGVLTIHVYDGTRRCHAHPNVVISSPCGQFDALCGECEYAMYRAEQEEQEAAAPAPAPSPSPDPSPSSSPVVWDFPF